jgi:MoxR-like ATPase
VVRDFDDNEDTGGSTKVAGAVRLHATISVDGVVTTKLLPATGELSIGRSAGCDLIIGHVSVSRRHATLRLSPLEILDEGSRNGTRVRGERIVAGVPAPVEVGDVVQLGDAALVLQAVPVSEAPRSIAEPPSPSPIDAELARSVRSRSPFALLQVQTTARPTDVLPVLRAIMRGTDVIRADAGGFQILLVDTTPEQVAQAVARLTHTLDRQGIIASVGVARYPDDGVVAEQLIAHAHAQLARERDAPLTAMDQVRELVRQVATGDLPVLVTGETGVGKELCAEMIHRLSPRAAMPFVRFNCSAIVESLVESELFGHEKGSFTGAFNAHPGLLETANGGTVCLDEVGELSLPVQAKLLRVLGERVVRRVGSTVGRKIDVRFIYATNRDLLEEVNAGRFRRDLYYRINGVRIVIPPLRERTDEIVPLARAFAARARRSRPLRRRHRVRRRHDRRAPAASVARQHPRAAQHDRARHPDVLGRRRAAVASRARAVGARARQLAGPARQLSDDAGRARVVRDDARRPSERRARDRGRRARAQAHHRGARTVRRQPDPGRPRARHVTHDADRAHGGVRAAPPTQARLAPATSAPP